MFRRVVLVTCLFVLVTLASGQGRGNGNRKGNGNEEEEPPPPEQSPFGGKEDGVSRLLCY